MEHRSSTRARHLTLFGAVPFAPFHMRCFFSNSAILVRHQVCRGLPLFRFPCGFHSSALFTTCPSGLLNVWPIHPQALCLISCSIGRCPVCLQNSLLLTFLGHQIRKMFLRLLLMNTGNFWCNKYIETIDQLKLCLAALLSLKWNSSRDTIEQQYTHKHTVQNCNITTS